MAINKVKASFCNNFGNPEDVLKTLESISKELRANGVDLLINPDSLFENEIDITITSLDGSNLPISALLSAHNEVEQRLEHLSDLNSKQPEANAELNGMRRTTPRKIPHPH